MIQCTLTVHASVDRVGDTTGGNVATGCTKFRLYILFERPAKPVAASSSRPTFDPLGI